MGERLNALVQRLRDPYMLLNAAAAICRGRALTAIAHRRAREMDLQRTVHEPKTAVTQALSHERIEHPRLDAFSRREHSAIVQEEPGRDPRHRSDNVIVVAE